MAVAFKTALGNNGSTTSTTTLVITTTAAVAVGDLVVVRWSADNLSATTPTCAVTDSGGNSYTAHAQKAIQATAAAGVAGGINVTKATAVVASGGTITLTFSGAIASKSAYAESFIGCDNTLQQAVVTNSGTSTACTTGTLVAGANGNMVLYTGAAETRATPTQISGGSTMVNVPSAASGTDTARTTVFGQYGIPTVNGGNYSGSYTVVNTDWVGMTIELKFTPATGRPKVRGASAWANKPLKVWTGSAWVEKPVKRWNGSAWVLVT